MSEKPLLLHNLVRTATIRREVRWHLPRHSTLEHQSSASEREHSSWRDAAEREGQRYGVDIGYVRAGLEGREFEGGGKRRTLIDCIRIAGATAVFMVLAAVARVPRMHMHLTWAAAFAAAMLVLLVSCGITLLAHDRVPVSNATHASDCLGSDCFNDKLPAANR